MYEYTDRVRDEDDKQSLELKRSCMYDLQSVVVHVGNLETGETIPYHLPVDVPNANQATISHTRGLAIKYVVLLSLVGCNADPLNSGSSLTTIT